MNVLYQMSG